MIWCLNQFKDFIPTFPLGGSFLSEKEFLNLYTVIHFSFPLRDVLMMLSKIEQIIKNTNT